MEAFSLLKFWRNFSIDTSSCREIISELDDMDYIRNPVIETDGDADSFFDLVFTGPDGRPKLDNNSKLVSVTSPCHPMIDSNSKPQYPISILKSPPKFRVFFLGFGKTKPVIDDCSEQTPNIQTHKRSPKAESKRFSASPVFTRDNSLRTKLQNEKDEELNVDESLKKYVRADVSKYLKLMKPLYTRASKRYTSKIGASPLSSPLTQSMCSEEKQGNRVASFGAVRKHLGKSRSAATGVSSSPMKRRDDSLLQEQNDGIQGAILHCKRSYSSLAKGTCTEDDLPRASQELNRWSI
ncbi:hypothetical protein RND71_018254 [Anisodus tanguticus]|uniref:Membrane-associated kinase regulator 2 n=1 Tax=Anisodus tanguticus TaxID=243964 RepID=A0AAE1S3W4_9SOLA|nr:hypothetical protein RND71_018254 [Anisodus tanguticus]